jgi:hydroxylaminobenzene mutase
VDVLTRIGLVELALGAVLGWAVAASMIRPAWVERVGVRKPRRILQAHLDYVIMGIILIAVGLAVPGMPVWLVVVIVVGTWVNPTLFVPLAFSPRAATRAWFQITSLVSFTATSGGPVGAAVVGLMR